MYRVNKLAVVIKRFDAFQTLHGYGEIRVRGYLRGPTGKVHFFQSQVPVHDLTTTLVALKVDDSIQKMIPETVTFLFVPIGQPSIQTYVLHYEERSKRGDGT